jgi:dihydrofolate reductase
MRVSLIVAAGRNGVIGRDGEIPWRLPEDQKFFRRMTTGQAIVMGRKTFDSIGKALPGRLNFALTRSEHPSVEDVVFLTSLDAALEAAAEAGVDECFIAGGEALYHEAMDRADRLYVTRVEATPDGDTFFPDVDERRFRCVDREPHPIDDRHAFAFTIETWHRHAGST